jgi:CBS domain-containing protein
MNSNVREVLARKGARVHTVPAGATVKAAAETMRDLRVGSVLVLRGDAIAGILTERDLARRVVYAGLPPETTRVDEVMTAPVAFVSPTTSVAAAMRVMSETHCRHLPVLDGDKLVGLVSLGDLVRWHTADQDAHVRFLESYIRGI